MPTEKTDAEKVALAEAMMAEAAALVKAARLPSAQAALDVLTGPKCQAFLAALKAAVDASADDLARPAGSTGEEGTKQMLQRIFTVWENTLAVAQKRVASLQPAPPPADPEAVPVTPAPAEA
ncbi:hypothetical protein [Brevundimonas sp. DWR2-3-1b1]|uniref:hypothetical protein n=1 Tax=unclassified Brevundimonas TaxID=2622653 RepID=UPI003CEFF648